MGYSKGDILLIRFPFTSLIKSKKRPVLLMSDENDTNDFVCFQITSQSTQNNICRIDMENIIDGSLKLKSYVKYDKCFTLNAKIVEKKLASTSKKFTENIKKLFCDAI